MTNPKFSGAQRISPFGTSNNVNLNAHNGQATQLDRTPQQGMAAQPSMDPNQQFLSSLMNDFRSQQQPIPNMPMGQPPMQNPLMQQGFNQAPGMMQPGMNQMPGAVQPMGQGGTPMDEQRYANMLLQLQRLQDSRGQI